MTDRESRVDQIIAAYLDAERAGWADAPDDVIARHPEFAAELKSFFADRARFVRVAGAPAVAPTEAETVGLDATPGPGDRVQYFGDYELLEEVARGGMGIVYKARQSRLNRTVALKLILSGQFASQADVDRFQREAQAVGNLDHPNIVPIYEVGEHDGRHYFTMRFVGGGSLQTRMEELRRDRRRAARLVATVARAVDYAHRRGVIHRDLKPGNILLDPAGEPMVVDFGLAKKVEGADTVTTTGAVVGTPAYMAPEQAAARKDVTTAVDVYGLGAILYECLAGRPPFLAGTPAETLYEVINREPARPRSVDGSVPPDLETIALKCLDKDPQKRYPTAAALADDLDRWLRGEPIAARPAGAVERAWRWVRRNAALTAAAAAVALALIAATAVSTQFAIRAHEHAKDADTARHDAENNASAEAAARLQATAELDRAEHFLYANQVALAHGEWRTGNRPRALELLDATRPDLRGWEWNYLRRLLNPDGPVLTGHTEIVERLAFSRDGQFVAAAGGYGTAGQAYFTRVWDARTGKEVGAYETRGGPALAYRPDLGLAATPTEGGIVLWDPRIGAELRRLPWEGSYKTRDRDGNQTTASFSGGRVEHLAFSPNGNRLAAAGSGHVLAWSMADGHRIFAAGGGGGVAFSPDGKFIASGTDLEAAQSGAGKSDAPVVRVWDVGLGTEVMALSGHAKPIRQVAFSPDGKLLVSVDWGNTLKLWDVEGKKEHRTIRLVDFADLAFSPDGARLATADRFDRRVSVWDTKTGEKLYSILSHARIVTAVAFSPDGNSLAAAGGERRDPDLSVRLWPGQTNPEATVFRGHTAGVWSAAFLPDSTRVVSTSGTGYQQPGQALLWDAKTGRELGAFEGHTSIVFCAAVSPDGKTLATGSADKTIRLWDIDTRRELQKLEGHKGEVTGLEFNHDGTRLVSVGHTAGRGEAPVEVRLWEVPGGRPVATVEGVQGMAGSVAFRPDGKQFAVTAAEVNRLERQITGVLTLHDAADGRVERTVRLDRMTRLGDVAYRPDGRRLAVVVGTLRGDAPRDSATAVREYDPEADAWRDLIPAHPGGPMGIAYSLDGRRVATGNMDGTVKIWDAESGRELLTLGGQRHPVGRVAFSPDGSRLVVAGGDAGTVTAWAAK